jgi:hypothetical protein
MKRWLKTVKIVVWVLLPIAIISSIIIILSPLINFFFGLDQKNNLLLTSNSSDKSTCLIIKYQDAFVFGPQAIFVYYKKCSKKKEQLLFTTRICNDGAVLIPENNCKIDWYQNEAKLTLMGAEQTPQEFLIHFGKKVRYQQIESN